MLIEPRVILNRTESLPCLASVGVNEGGGIVSGGIKEVKPAGSVFVAER
jgi:hypothetical protein